MNDVERKQWATLLDARRIYDEKKREPINLPQNYLGVAARIAAYAYEFGILTDRAFLDSLIDRAAIQFTSGALFADDDLPNGRYDRYSNEYVRFCWKAAEVTGRKDILDKLRPSMKAQMQLWWDLVWIKGYGYNWGRSGTRRLSPTRSRSPPFWVRIRNFDPRLSPISRVYITSLGVGSGAGISTRNIRSISSRTGVVTTRISAVIAVSADRDELCKDHHRSRQLY